MIIRRPPAGNEHDMNRLKLKLLLTIFSLLLFTAMAQAEQRLVLSEQFTNTACDQCVTTDSTIDHLLENYPDYFALIRYHTYYPSEEDPFYLFSGENTIRVVYYGVWEPPVLKIDGLIDSDNYTLFWTIISDRYTVDAPLSIEAGGTFNYASRSGNLQLRLIATEPITLPGLFVRIALTESHIFFEAPNGQTEQNAVMRYMFPNSTGIRLYIDDGDTVDISQAISCPEPLVIENCELVVFVQAHQEREILQAARISLTDLETVDIEAPTGLPSDFELSQNYPNPFNAATNITYALLTESRVHLDIYNLAGRRVVSLLSEMQPAGKHQVIWDGRDSHGQKVSSGIYFYRLIADGQSLARQMMLLK